jgi:imidazole glycerol-phosphate synthase subunit HisF
MDYRRIIPCLDVKDGRLVKGVHFEDLKDVGDPADVAAAYSTAGADELILLDITATTEKRKTLMDVVRKTSARITVPLTVGGGVRTVSDIENLLCAGASRVSINTAAVREPGFITDAAEEFGSECVAIALDVRKAAKCRSGYEVVTHGGRKGTGLDAVEWAVQAEDLGAGTLLPTSMENDGTLLGYDLKITRAIADAVAVPVIASGGAGKLEHLYEAIVDGHADAVLVASIAHFGTFTLKQMKDYLAGRGISVRPKSAPRSTPSAWKMPTAEPPLPNTDGHED